MPLEVKMLVMDHMSTCNLLNLGYTSPNYGSLVQMDQFWKNVLLSDMNFVTQEVFESLFNKKEIVKVFLMRGSSHLLHPHSLNNLLFPLTNLTTLVLSDSRLVYDLYFVLDRPCLEHLEIDRVTNVGHHSFHNHLTKTSALKYLSTESNTQLDKYDLVYVGKALTKLEMLSMDHCQGLPLGDVQMILVNCPQMKSFYFNVYYFLSDHSAWELVVKKQFSHMKFYAYTEMQVDLYQWL